MIDNKLFIAEAEKAGKVKEDDRLPPLKQDSSTQRDTQEEPLKKEGESSRAKTDRPKQVDTKEVGTSKEHVEEYALIDKSVTPWEISRPGTVYERKEMRREIVTETPKSTIWREKQRRGQKGKVTEVLRTYEKIREYRRFIDEYDPDFVD
ncbi:hypothetical protein GCK32_014950 [Trichostrongylus colubriformis]|uniref:Uncharacterized protein n=1 Tax=Trichostrongylus colubriformis TaxID=6319 RepID=A0AAN8ID57_TRICO